mgnify:FL=1
MSYRQLWEGFFRFTWEIEHRSKALDSHGSFLGLPEKNFLIDSKILTQPILNVTNMPTREAKIVCNKKDADPRSI